MEQKVADPNFQLADFTYLCRKCVREMRSWPLIKVTYYVEQIQYFYLKISSWCTIERSTILMFIFRFQVRRLRARLVPTTTEESVWENHPLLLTRMFDHKIVIDHIMGKNDSRWVSGWKHVYRINFGSIYINLIVKLFIVIKLNANYSG